MNFPYCSFETFKPAISTISCWLMSFEHFWSIDFLALRLNFDRSIHRRVQIHLDIRIIFYFSVSFTPAECFEGPVGDANGNFAQERFFDAQSTVSRKLTLKVQIYTNRWSVESVQSATARDFQTKATLSTSIFRWRIPQINTTCSPRHTYRALLSLLQRALWPCPCTTIILSMRHLSPYAWFRHRNSLRFSSW